MNTTLTAFNLRYGNRPEANLFIEKYKEISLPLSLLGKEISLFNHTYIFFGIELVKPSGINFLNYISNKNYSLKSYYKVVLFNINPKYKPFIKNINLKDSFVYLNIDDFKMLLPFL